MRIRRMSLFICAAIIFLGLPMASMGYSYSVNGVTVVSVTSGNDIRDPNVDGYCMFVETDGRIIVEFELNASATSTDVNISSATSEHGYFSSISLMGNSIIAGTNNNNIPYKAYCVIKPELSKGARQTSINILVNGAIIDIPFFFDKTSDPPEVPRPTAPADDTPEPGDVPFLLMLSPVDKSGAVVPSPMGDAGDNITLRLPILNRGGYYGSVATQIIVTPEISANLDNFPFVVESVDYSRQIKELRQGEIGEINYTFKLSKEVKSGVKEVKFNLVYYNRFKQAYETTKLSVFVTVVKGKEDDTIADADGETITTQPKIIIESSSLTPDAPQEGDEEGRLYAGEPFTLRMSIRNTSSEEAIKNIQITLNNEGNVIIPANNGSNSLYIDKIAPGDIVEREVKLQTVPDAEPKSQSLGVKFAYESSKTLKGYTEQQDIAVPILQRVRVRMNDPLIFGEGMVDQTLPMSISVYNLSKSVLYYCSIEIEGEGLRLEEPFYYGNLSGGGSMQADFNVIPSVEGNIDGKVIFIFEDAYNKQTRLEKPFSFSVMPGFSPDMGMIDGDWNNPEMMPPQKPVNNTLLWVGIIGGAALLVGGFFAFRSIRKKRREKELTDYA